MSDPGPRRVVDPVSIPFRSAPATGYPPKTVLCAQGDPATHVFLIEEGSAALIRSSPDGREIILGFRGAGSVLGTTPAILGGGRAHSASIVTVSRTRTRTLPAGVFLHSLDGTRDSWNTFTGCTLWRSRSTTGGSPDWSSRARGNGWRRSSGSSLRWTGEPARGFGCLSVSPT